MVRLRLIAFALAGLLITAGTAMFSTAAAYIVAGLLLGAAAITA